MAPHSSTLAWKIPWTEEPVAAVRGVAKSRTQLSDFTFAFHFHALEKEMATHSSFLAGESQGRGSRWAAVYGVPQSRTRLKRLSSSSSSSSLTFFSIFFSAHTSKMLLNSAIYLPITGIKNLASPLCFNNPLPQLVSYMFT